MGLRGPGRASLHPGYGLGILVCLWATFALRIDAGAGH